MQEASIFRRSNGYYYIRSKLPNRSERWISTGTKNRREAERFLAHLAAERRQTAQAHSTPVTLGEASESFMQYARANLAANTVKRYDRILTAFSQFIGTGTALQAITAQRIEQYKAQRLAVVRPVTVNTELRHIKAMLGHAVRFDMLADNPFRRVRFIKLPERTPEYLTRPEFARLHAAIREDWFRDLVTFAVSTGLRQSEICFLRWESVDMPRRQIRVESSDEFTTKSGRNRVVPVPAATAAVLARREANGREGYVFTFRGKRIRQDHVSSLFKRYARELCLDDRVTFHSLRKTYATWLVQAGVSLFAVQRLLGHSSPATTMKYATLAASDLHAVVDNAALGDMP